MLHLLLLLSLSLSSTSATRFGYDVGSTSMDSTHYDRRLFHDQCPTSHDLTRASFWATARSLSPPSANASNATQWIPFRRQLIVNNGDERLVTRVPIATANSTANQTRILGIDQATVDILVDNQVSHLSLDRERWSYDSSVSFRFWAI